MTSLKFHILDARGTFVDHHGWLMNKLTEAYEKAAALIPIRQLDVVIQKESNVFPEQGHLGYAPRPGVVFVTVDPANPALLTNCGASLERMFVHELHHAARWDDPGYGLSLGEALVSEGLAGHFAQEIYGGPPELWEQLSIAEVQRHILSATQEWHRTDYDHQAWFYGLGELPRWLGYSLGYQLVARFLAQQDGQKASGLVNEKAHSFFNSI